MLQLTHKFERVEREISLAERRRYLENIASLEILRGGVVAAVADTKAEAIKALQKGKIRAELGPHLTEIIFS